MDHSGTPEATSSILTEKRPSQSSEVHRGKGKRKGSIATKGLTEDKKVPPRAGSRRLAEANACRPLKLQLQRQLQLARGAGIGRRETRAGDGSESCQRAWSQGRGQNHKAVSASWISKIRMVKEIERIGSELQVEPLGDFGVLDERQIQVRKSGTIKNVAAQIADSVWSRRGQRCRGIANPLCRISADLHWPYQVRADGVASPRRVGCGKDDVERIPSLYGQDGRQFPSADEAVGFEVQGVNGIRY